MREIKYIVLHCTAGPQNQTIEAIKAFWKTKGWKRPGYHHMITADGEVHDLWPIEKPSNGVAGFNAHSINISYLGGVTADGKVIDNRTPAQKQSQRLLVQGYHALYPKAVILGHRDFSPDKNRDGIIQPNEWMKSCPSFSVKDWLKAEGIIENPVTIEVKKTIITTTGHGVNVRKGPGTQFEKIAAIEDGQSCLILSTDGLWSQVVFNDNLQGWIISEYLK